MRLLIGIAAGLLFAATTVTAAPEQKDRPEDKIVCKRIYDNDTGSHFQSTKRVCHTALEWKEIEDGTERALRANRENSAFNPAGQAPSMGGGPP